MTNRPTHPFAGARRMKPTLKHRPAIWECLLGTVYARSPEGETRYFDYDWDAARAFAQVAPERDPRVYRSPGTYSMGNSAHLSKGQLALYLKATP